MKRAAPRRAYSWTYQANMRTLVWTLAWVAIMLGLELREML